MSYKEIDGCHINIVEERYPVQIFIMAQRNASDVWAAIEYMCKDTGMKLIEWKQSFQGINAAIDSIGFKMITTQTELDDMDVPLYNGWKKYGWRKITISKDGSDALYTSTVEEILRARCKFMKEDLPLICKMCGMSEPDAIFRKQCRVCITCQDILRREKLSELPCFLGKLMYGATNTAIKRGKKHPGSPVGICTIAAEDLMAIWKNQNEKCYYSNIAMNALLHSCWQCSLERKDQNIGYILSNVVLCCLEFNNRMQWSHDKIDRLFNKINEPYVFQPPEPRQFYKLLSSARTSTKRRKQRKTVQVRDNEMDIDLTFIIELFNKQQGRCAISNIPMSLSGNVNNTEWKCSLDRIQALTGYMKDNVQLVAYEFNVSTYEMRVIPEYINGKQEWTKEKFAIFEQHYYARNASLSVT